MSACILPRACPRRALLLAVTATAAAFAVALVGCGGGTSGATPSGTTGPGTTTSAAPTSAPTSPAPTSPASSTTPSPSSPSAVPRLRSGYLPLWPFADATSVLAWQRRYRSDGTQPWHRSERETALSFARSYLGYTEIDRVTSRSGSSTDALVGVGWLNPNGKAVTVGRIHLLRFGTTDDAPWEVVGTHDTRLTLTTPHYGTTVTSPMTVGGRITGVDESLVVTVRTMSSSRPVVQTEGLPAGGEDTPWRTSVTYTAPKGAVLTIAVSTGGHLMTVEEFAVTGVRNSGTAPVVDGAHTR